MSSTREAPEEFFAGFAAGTPEEPFLLAQLGQSLDGRIATPTGDSKYINGEYALDHLHRLRARVDAVVVGVQTVVADDPLLTVRRCAGPDPVRVVVDPNGRMPPGARLLREGGHTIVISRAGGAPDGAQPLPLGDDFSPVRIRAALGALGFARVLVEGGATTISRFVDAGLIDRMHVLVAPLLIGSGRPGLELAPIAALADARRPDTRVHVFPDGDVLFDCNLNTRVGGEA